MSLQATIETAKPVWDALHALFALDDDGTLIRPCDEVRAALAGRFSLHAILCAGTIARRHRMPARTIALVDSIQPSAEPARRSGVDAMGRPYGPRAASQFAR